MKHKVNILTTYLRAGGVTCGVFTIFDNPAVNAILQTAREWRSPTNKNIARVRSARHVYTQIQVSLFSRSQVTERSAESRALFAETCVAVRAERLYGR